MKIDLSPQEAACLLPRIKEARTYYGLLAQNPSASPKSRQALELVRGLEAKLEKAAGKKASS